MLQKIKFTLLIAAIAFTLIVALQNTDPMGVEILFYSISLSKTVLIMPSCSPRAIALPLPMKGNRPTLTS